MKRFLTRVVMFSVVTVGVFLGVLSTADGWTDAYYLRFTTPTQQSLIVGTSRAAQGLQPAVFDSLLNLNIYNYAFTFGHSPYGPTYLHSIKAKVDTSSTNGTFIVAVDPWSLCSSKAAPNDSLLFEERDRMLATTPCVNCKPNFTYLIDHLSGRYYSTLFRNKGSYHLHDDGWLAITVNMDEDKVRKRTVSKIREYREGSFIEKTYSSLRFAYLQKTIDYLKRYGEVYLVRLPVGPEMLALETEFDPLFEERMQQLAPKTAGYLDLTPQGDRFRYTDGNHLATVSAPEVSRKVAVWMKNQSD